jgi:outer membrane protein OmpA-like peptidoglycan-associated protein
MRRGYLVLCVALLAILLLGCAKHQQVGAVATAPAPTESSPPVPLPSGSPIPEQPQEQGSAAPSPSATATGPVNLLAFNQGVLIREWPPTDPSGSPYGLVDQSGGAWVWGSWSSAKGAQGPFVWVFELPAPATITRFEAVVTGDPKTDAQSIHVAASSTGVDSGYADVGTYTLTQSPQRSVFPLDSPITARWLKLTVDALSGSDVTALTTFAAYGEFVESAAAPKQVAGSWLIDRDPGVAGDPLYVASRKFSEKVGSVLPTGNHIAFLNIVERENAFRAIDCNALGIQGVWGGTQTGYRLMGNTVSPVYYPISPAPAVLNAEGTLLIGTGSAPFIAVRLRNEHACPTILPPLGRGKSVLVLLPKGDELWAYPPLSPPLRNTTTFQGYRFIPATAAMLMPQQLIGVQSVVIRNVCDASTELAKWQALALLDYVSVGHKLIIQDSDTCSVMGDYSFLPFAFTTSNPGARGAKGSALVLVESDGLGSDKLDPAHFVDVNAYVSDASQQLGDANTVTSQAPQWCGHLFGVNALNKNGFMQMYAPYGKGLIIFDGLDHDDLVVPQYLRLQQLELAAEVPPDLPCTQKVSGAFIIEPDQTAKFVPGKAAKLNFSMKLLANQGWKGHVLITTTGDFRAAVTPANVDIAGGTQALTVAVSIPANIKAGVYAVLVNGDGGAGRTAQATINLAPAVAMATVLKVQRRIRIYGIHFDVDKATIKPQSEATIAQIAQIMQQNPTWRFRVEGHTDSDGGYQHNMVLSQQRAQAVVNDLINRYKIGRSRLVPVGYGYSHPVASNATEAGKALNRRVELFRL